VLGGAGLLRASALNARPAGHLSMSLGTNKMYTLNAIVTDEIGATKGVAKQEL